MKIIILLLLLFVLLLLLGCVYIGGREVCGGRNRGVSWRSMFLLFVFFYHFPLNAAADSICIYLYILYIFI